MVAKFINVLTRFPLFWDLLQLLGGSSILNYLREEKKQQAKGKKKKKKVPLWSAVPPTRDYNQIFSPAIYCFSFLSYGKSKKQTIKKTNKQTKRKRKEEKKKRKKKRKEERKEKEGDEKACCGSKRGKK